MTGPEGTVGFRPHSAHWGVFSAAWRQGELVVRPHPDDPDPNRILQNFPRALRHEARIARPMVRRGWLEQGPGAEPRRAGHARRGARLEWIRVRRSSSIPPAA